MDKENKFIEKLDIESTKEFEIYKNIFSNNIEDKELLYSFLFGDLISNDKLNEIIDIETILKNPEIIIENKINTIVDKITEKDNNLLEEVKKKFNKTRSEMKMKIQECNEHIEILKKTYIDKLIKNYIPINNENKLIFTNKKVLILQNLKKDNYSLAERFIRIIFNEINKEEQQEFVMNNNINVSNNNFKNYEIKSFNNFYDEDKINIFNENNVLRFNEMNNNFKYWIVLTYLISQIFNNNSNYEILFNERECKINIEKLLKNYEEKKKEKGKNKKEKDKKYDKDKKRGGDKEDYYKDGKKNREDSNKYKKHQSKNRNKDKEKNKEKNKNINIKNLYNDIFENCYIKNDINLKKIYVLPFEKNIKDYFISFLVKKNNTIKNNISKVNNLNKNKNTNETLNEIINETVNDAVNDVGNKKSNNESNEIHLGGGILFQDPFEDKNIELKNIVDIKNTNIIKNNGCVNLIKNRKLKYDIFQSLKLYKNEDNLKKLYLFISKIKIKLILLLYALYKLKKTLYEKYLDKINIVFFNNEVRKKNNTINTDKKLDKIKKNTNNTQNRNNETNNRNRQNNLNKSNNISKIDKKNIDINLKIKNIENEIKLMQNKKGTKNYDEELLSKEEQIKELLIEKYKNRFL